MPKFKKVYPVYPEQRGGSYRSGFYHPISILILAAITLTVALAIFANSGFFANKNVPIPPSPTLQPSPKPSPKASSTNTNQVGANWKTYTNQQFKFTFKYPSDWYFVDHYTGYESGVELKFLKIGTNEDYSGCGDVTCAGNVLFYYSIGQQDSSLGVLDKNTYANRQEVQESIVAGKKALKLQGCVKFEVSIAGNRLMQICGEKLDQILSTFQFLN